MNINYDPYFRSYEDQLLFEEMVEELRKRPKKPPTTEQAASTQRTLDRDPKDDEAWFFRPLPENWKAVPSAKTIEEAVGTRGLNPIEISHVESIRRRPKNSLGNTQRSSVSGASRARGIDAILFSGPATVTKQEIKDRAVNLTAYKSTPPPQEVWVELPWYKALFHWFRGNKIKTVDKDVKSIR